MGALSLLSVVLASAVADPFGPDYPKCRQVGHERPCRPWSLASAVPCRPRSRAPTEPSAPTALAITSCFGPDFKNRVTPFARTRSLAYLLAARRLG